MMYAMCRRPVSHQTLVVPAKAGTQSVHQKAWLCIPSGQIPAFAGMTTLGICLTNCNYNNVHAIDHAKTCLDNHCLGSYITVMTVTNQAALMNPIIQFYDADTYRIEHGVGYLLNQLAQTLARELDHRMIDLGLTNAQWKPLLFLQQGACSTAADLSRIACHDTGAVTRLVDRLEGKGLVRRLRSADDRRVVKLELTEEGKKIAAEVPKIIAQLSNEVLAGFSEEEFLVFKDLLNRALLNARALADGHSQ